DPPPAQCETDLLSVQSQLSTAKAQIQDLQAWLTTANATIAAQQGTITSLNSQIQDLQARLITANATIAAQQGTITSVITDLLGGRPDANVATAARAASQAKIQAASAKVGPADPRVQTAQRKFDEGLAALAAGDFSRAVREFRHAFEMASHVL